MPKNLPVKTKTTEEIRQGLKDSSTGLDAWYILREADKEMGEMKKKTPIGSDTNFYKALTLLEFDKGVLLMNAVSKLYNVFALEFNKNLQTEYNCQTPSEKSLAETVALNFVMTLYIQSKITNYLEKGSVSDLGVGYINSLSKELDRAQRHYLASLNALRSLRMPPLEVNIKTQTAVVGNNQVVQTINKPI